MDTHALFIGYCFSSQVSANDVLRIDGERDGNFTGAFYSVYISQCHVMFFNNKFGSRLVKLASF